MQCVSYACGYLFSKVAGAVHRPNDIYLNSLKLQLAISCVSTSISLNLTISFTPIVCRVSLLF